MGLLLSATVVVVADWAWPHVVLGHAGDVMLVGGLATGVIAATTGSYELWRLSSVEPDDASGSIIDRHMLVVATALCVYGAATWTHFVQRPGFAALLSSVGAVVLGFGAHLGGLLVYSHGIGQSTGHRDDERRVNLE